MEKMIRQLRYIPVNKAIKPLQFTHGKKFFTSNTHQLSLLNNTSPLQLSMSLLQPSQSLLQYPNSVQSNIIPSMSMQLLNNKPIEQEFPESSGSCTLEEQDSTSQPIIQAIKRTYQPSSLRRKRKHGFLKRRLSIGGRKILKRRFLKGRKRFSA